MRTYLTILKNLGVEDCVGAPMANTTGRASHTSESTGILSDLRELPPITRRNGAGTIRDSRISGGGESPQHATDSKRREPQKRFQISRTAIPARRRIADSKMVDATTNSGAVYRSEHGRFLGSGEFKDVYGLRDDRAVAILRPGSPGDMLKGELGCLDILASYGIPTLKAEPSRAVGRLGTLFRAPLDWLAGVNPVLHSQFLQKVSRPAYVCDEFAQSSREIIVQSGEEIRVIDGSPYLNERSVRDLNTIRETLLREKISVTDLQFLIASDGRVVVYDPYDVVVGEVPAAIDLKAIDALISLARNRLDPGPPTKPERSPVSQPGKKPAPDSVRSLQAPEYPADVQGAACR